MCSYYALKGHSASGQGGSSWSSPLRSDGSRDDQAGEAGPVEQQLNRGQESQNYIGLKGPSDYHSNEIAVKVARW
jgi:hypothetical protein